MRMTTKLWIVDYDKRFKTLCVKGFKIFLDFVKTEQISSRKFPSTLLTLEFKSLASFQVVFKLALKRLIWLQFSAWSRKNAEKIDVRLGCCAKKCSCISFHVACENSAWGSWVHFVILYIIAHQSNLTIILFKMLFFCVIVAR